MDWQKKAEGVLREAIACHTNGYERSALQCLYDAVSVVCDLGHSKGHRFHWLSGKRFFVYREGIEHLAKMLDTEEEVKRTLLEMGATREASAHRPYAIALAPGQMERFIQTCIRFFDMGSLLLPDDLIGLIPRGEIVDGGEKLFFTSRLPKIELTLSLTAIPKFGISVVLPEAIKREDDEAFVDLSFNHDLVRMRVEMVTSEASPQEWCRTTLKSYEDEVSKVLVREERRMRIGVLDCAVFDWDVLESGKRTIRGRWIATERIEGRRFYAASLYTYPVEFRIVSPVIETVFERTTL